eukprot:3941805-Rhodomonas_salina.1
MSRECHVDVRRIWSSLVDLSQEFIQASWADLPEDVPQVFTHPPSGSGLVRGRRAGGIYEHRSRSKPRFEGTDEGEVTEYLSCDIVPDRWRGTLKIKQSAYIQRIALAHHECHGAVAERQVACGACAHPAVEASMSGTHDTLPAVGTVLITTLFAASPPSPSRAMSTWSWSDLACSACRSHGHVGLRTSCRVCWPGVRQRWWSPPALTLLTLPSSSSSPGSATGSWDALTRRERARQGPRAG